MRDVSENGMISEGSCTLFTPDLALDPKHDPGVRGCVNASATGFSAGWVMSGVLARTHGPFD